MGPSESSRPASPGSVRVALVGDYDPAVTAHRAIDHALPLAAADTGVEVIPSWIPTRDIGADPADVLHGHAALWCVPASPYRNPAGALGAIRHARENGLPFLGTCGGFQHAALEFARNVLGVEAFHEETDLDAPHPVISRLACSLVEEREVVRFRPGSRLGTLYPMIESTEGYHCRFGLNPQYIEPFDRHGFRASAWNSSEEVRGLELDGHPFFVCTLFQIERSSLQGRTHPLISAWVLAAAGPS